MAHVRRMDGGWGPAWALMSASRRASARSRAATLAPAGDRASPPPEYPVHMSC